MCNLFLSFLIVQRVSLVPCQFAFQRVPFIHVRFQLNHFTINVFLFTLIIGALFRVETITTQKVLALVVSIVGLYLITVSSAAANDDTNNDAVAHSNAWIGNLMALLSAVVYGLYTTLLKVCIGDNESRINMYLFFGFVGLFNIILLWPVITLFNYIGVETFELPGSLHVWVIVLANAATTIISDFCWALAMLMTSPPSWSPWGLSATIPLAIAGDMILKSHYA